MRFSRLLLPAVPASVVLILLVAGTSSAAPITVQLRVEGSAQTLYEGPVVTDGIESPPGISTPSSGGAHACDVKDNGSNGGFGAPAGTPTTALYDAATSAGLAFDAKWFAEATNDFFVTQVGPDIEGGAPEFASWGYAVNFTTANVGGCQFQLAPGSEVLWAYNYFNLTHLLSLSGPSSANAGTPFALHVVDGRTGQPVAGAQIGEDVHGVTTSIPGTPATDASGNATITLAHSGTFQLKATEPKSVRSNALSVCVHSGSDGTCGTTVPPPPPPAAPAVVLARIVGIKSGQAFSRRSAPRLLGGTVQLSGGATLRDVRIRLQRRYRGRCFNFSGVRASFVRSAHCRLPSFFSVGAAQSFTYLLPARLRPGRYVYDIEAIDATGHATALSGGTSHVVFRVR